MKLWLARSAESYQDRNGIVLINQARCLTDHGRVEAQYLGHRITKALGKGAVFDVIANPRESVSRATAQIVAVTVGYNRLSMLEHDLFDEQRSGENADALRVRVKESRELLAETGAQSALIVTGPNYINAMQRDLNPRIEFPVVPIGGYVQLL